MNNNFRLSIKPNPDATVKLKDAIEMAKQYTGYNIMIMMWNLSLTGDDSANKLIIAMARSRIVDVIGHLWVKPDGDWAEKLSTIVEREGIAILDNESSRWWYYPVFNEEPPRPSVPE